MATKSVVVLANGQILRGQMTRSDYRPATVKRFVDVDQLEERIARIQDEWFAMAKDTGADIRDMHHVDILRMIDDFCHAAGIEVDTGDDQED